MELWFNCQTIIYVLCWPLEDAIPHRMCKGYIDAAKDAGFEMMVTATYFRDDGTVKPVKDIHYRTMKVTEALRSFVDNSDTFIQNNGHAWFFCKCNPIKQNECIAMTPTCLNFI